MENEKEWGRLRPCRPFQGQVVFDLFEEHRHHLAPLTPTLVAMLKRIEQHSGALLMLAVTASGGGEYGKLNKLRGAGYVVKCEHPSVTEGAWPAEALAITEAGRTALAKHGAETTEKKGQRRS